MSRIPALLFVILIFSSCSDPRHYFEDRSAARNKSSTLKDDSGLTQKDSGLIKITPLDEPSPFPTVAPSLPGVRSSTTVTATFSGDIAGAGGKQKFYNFLQKNEQKTIKLDLLLSDDQVQQINDVDRGKTWYFDLGFQDKDSFPTGGELLIEVAKSKGDLKLTGNHLSGNIKVTNWSGPHQGLMSITALPATSGAVPNINTPPLAMPRPTVNARPRSVKPEIKTSDNNPPI